MLREAALGLQTLPTLRQGHDFKSRRCPSQCRLCIQSGPREDHNHLVLMRCGQLRFTITKYHGLFNSSPELIAGIAWGTSRILCWALRPHGPTSRPNGQVLDQGSPGVQPQVLSKDVQKCSKQNKEKLILVVLVPAGTFGQASNTSSNCAPMEQGPDSLPHSDFLLLRS